MRKNTQAKIQLVGIRITPIYDDCNRRARMIRQIARELFVTPRTVQRWFVAYRIEQAGGSPNQGEMTPENTPGKR